MSIPGVRIRLAAEADRAEVLALAPRLAEGVAPWRDHEEALAAGGRWLEDSLAAAAKGDGAVLVAADGDGIVGVISIRPARHFTGEHDGYIGELAVAERASRRGTGRALVSAADAWACEHGLKNLTLHTGAFNAGARAFYAALGFAEEEVRLTRPAAKAELLTQDTSGTPVTSIPDPPGVISVKRRQFTGRYIRRGLEIYDSQNRISGATLA